MNFKVGDKVAVTETWIGEANESKRDRLKTTRKMGVVVRVANSVWVRWPNQEEYAYGEHDLIKTNGLDRVLENL